MDLILKAIKSSRSQFRPDLPKLIITFFRKGFKYPFLRLLPNQFFQENFLIKETDCFYFAQYSLKKPHSVDVEKRF
jgi:hypothetical protein